MLRLLLSCALQRIMPYSSESIKLCQRQIVSKMTDLIRFELFYGLLGISLSHDSNSGCKCTKSVDSRSGLNTGKKMTKYSIQDGRMDILWTSAAIHACFS